MLYRRMHIEHCQLPTTQYNFAFQVDVYCTSVLLYFCTVLYDPRASLQEEDRTDLQNPPTPY